MKSGWSNICYPNRRYRVLDTELFWFTSLLEIHLEN